jgi:hypothetical protein
MMGVQLQQASEDGEPFQAIFKGLPEASRPAHPGEPGGAAEAYDTRVWFPDYVEAYRIQTFSGYVTLQTASELFNVQRERLQMACSRGVLPAKKVPMRVGRAAANDPTRPQGVWMVHAGDVARYLASTLKGPTPGNRKVADAGTQRQREALELERQRLLESAQAAESRAAAARAQAEEIARNNPELTYRQQRQQQGGLVISERQERVRARNRRRVAEDASRRLADLEETERRREAAGVVEATEAV